MTRRAGLFGLPLRRRHSPTMHNAAFAEFGIDGRYDLVEVDVPGLPDQVALARDEGWFGFQITAPHKKAIMPLLDRIEPDALRIGAVNSVVLEDDGALVGGNTDVLGFLADLARLELPPNARVVVAGAGGVARAIVFGLLTTAPARVSVLARRLQEAQQLVGSYADLGALEALELDGVDARNRLAEADLFVNATAVGMLTPGPVIPVAALAADCAVYDVVYLPRQTPLLLEARARGIRAANGEGMLVAQAASTFVRWTGSPDPTAVMRAAVERELADPLARP